MGGTIAFTLRLEDGTEYRMNRWTNILPWAIKNIKFIAGNKGHASEILDQWVSMKADWERNKNTGKFKFNMTQCYAPYPAELVPNGYGIVVADQVTKNVLYSQGYCSLIDDRLMGFTDESDPDEIERMRELYDAGRYKVLSIPERSGGGLVWNDTSLPPFEKLTEMSFDRSKWLSRLVIDFSPFTVTRFPESPEGIRQALTKVKELGFSLSAQEEASWEGYVKLRWSGK